MASIKYDVPPEIRPLYKLIEKLYNRHDSMTVLQDFLMMVVAQMSYDFEKEHAEAMRRYSADDKKVLNEMFVMWIQILDAQLAKEENPDGLGVKGWYDPFGELYMALTSRYKQGYTGQFFTPDHLCDMMAQMNRPEGDGLGKRCSDPACGSGRMALAMKALAPGMKYYCIDKDYTCFLMAAVNMASHGCQGEIMCGDSLWPEWEHVTIWAVNEHPAHYLMGGVPTIQKITYQESIIYANYESMRTKVEDVPAKDIKSETQLTLF